MQFSSILVAVFASMALALPSQSLPRDDALSLLERAVNNGRPVANGACCIEATSKKQDVCNNNGVAGKCSPANTAGCGTRLTCVT